ncbi:MAG: thioredoxin fold domain-containing protein [Planctomycetes bacterium]|nr:thioredoxin fold domain-containing protein [Planctomycetota bacterium]
MSTTPRAEDALIVPCAACGALNRVPTARLRDVPICSDCRARLLGAAPAQLKTASFDRFVGRAGLPVAVDFWAPWCGPCRTMAPHFAAAAEPLATTALLAKVDTEANPELGQRFEIRGLPTMVLFVGGREVARVSGAMARDAIVQWVESNVGAL